MSAGTGIELTGQCCRCGGPSALDGTWITRDGGAVEFCLRCADDLLCLVHGTPDAALARQRERAERESCELTGWPEPRQMTRLEVARHRLWLTGMPAAAVLEAAP